ncbi:MAG: DUF167 domain-containing protein [Stagnimonas sp.]|nr:DUF167 domain-containing protein [Stagnimonas sp.]
MAGTVRLPLKVAPKASRNAINGWMGETLKVSVTVAPEKGKANQAVIELLAEALRLPKSAVRIVRGETSTSKLAEIEGIDELELRRKLSA